MSSGGLKFGDARAELAEVVANGVDQNDPRVISKTNEAIRAIISKMVCVNGCMTIDIAATGTNGDELFLPREMDTAIEVEVLEANVNGQSDISQGYYDIVNPFTYADPQAAHDNPLQDLFLQPDPNDPSILRRLYRYPGLTPNATVRVTGAKSYVPITGNNDYLIVQNILAIKDMIQAIWRKENNDPAGAKMLRDSCFEELTEEVKRHQLDPRNAMRRKGEYEADLVNYANGTFGYARARLAFELPGGLVFGKSELTRILEQAEMTLIDAGDWVGTLQEYTATIDGPEILAPKEVGSIIAIDLCNQPIDIRSVYARYIQGGCTCCPELRDEGEIFNKQTGERRRQYRLTTLTLDDNRTDQIRFIGSLRWVKKNPEDELVIKNFQALKMACHAQIHQRAERWDDAMKALQLAIHGEGGLDDELGKWLAGQIVIAPVNLHGGFARHGVL